MAQTLLWYDLETFGTNPYWDRVAQFAAVRTDDNFEPVEEPVVLYCRIPPDYIPDPKACLVTGITPQETLQKGLSEYDFIRAIDRELSRPGTTVVGFNSIRFDDEFVRNLYYRNFMDPYQREWANGNSRWDIIDLVRVTRDLRPEGINWPVSEETGRPTIRLEKLTEANRIGHQHAHDALSDVYATIEVAKLIQRKQPRLFKWVFDKRTKNSLRPLIELENMTPLLHTSGMLTTEKGCTAIMAPLAVDPANRNCLYFYDLRVDPQPLIDLPVEEIRRRVFTRTEELGDTPRIPLKGIHINKCPVLAPLTTLTPEAEERLGLDRIRCEIHRQKLLSHREIIQKVRQVFEKESSDSSAPPVKEDPDGQIYSGGFFRDDDKACFELVHNTLPENLYKLQPPFRDPRLPEMLRRFTGRNFPETLPADRARQWRSYCAGRLLFPPVQNASDFGEFRKRLENLRQSEEVDARGKVIIKALSDYGDFLEKEILSYREESPRG
ncbi:MAG: exodeoxyribonuclease I [Spirochaetales bacterium]|nr:exodeoxyribonuclease I [Spirochaetales bacterium]